MSFTPRTFDRLSDDSTEALYRDIAFVIGGEDSVLPFPPVITNPHVYGFPQIWDTSGGYDSQIGNRISIQPEGISITADEIALEFSTGKYTYDPSRAGETWYYTAWGMKDSVVDIPIVNDIYDEIERTQIAIADTTAPGDIPEAAILFDTTSGHDHDGVTSHSIAHDSLTGITADNHHDQIHALDSTNHTGTLPESIVAFESASGHSHDGTDSTKIYHSSILGVGINDHHNKQHAIDSTDDHSGLPLAESHVLFDTTAGHVHNGSSATEDPWAHFHGTDFSPTETPDGTNNQFTTSNPFIIAEDGTTPLMQLFVSGIIQKPGVHFIAIDTTTYEILSTPQVGDNIVHFYVSNTR